MRQVLEVFDILVKNQDPESTRTLYTYLFTRPSTGKRLEFLVESATEGRGLDEIIHLFQHPSHVGNSAAGHDDYLPQFEEYESPDDYQRNDGAGGQEIGQEAYETRDHSMFGEVTNHEEGEPQGGHPGGAAGTGRDDLGTRFEQEFKVEGAVEYAYPDGEPRDQEPDEGFDAEELGDSAAAMMADLEESEQVPADQDISSGFGGRAMAAETSTSTTIQGDDETHAAAHTSEHDGVHDDAIVDNSAEAEDLDEIDWRDDADLQPDEGSVESSIPVKRAHGDADLDLDDSQSRQTLASNFLGHANESQVLSVNGRNQEPNTNMLHFI